jgi:hypothetical protein
MFVIVNGTTSNTTLDQKYYYFPLASSAAFARLSFASLSFLQEMHSFPGINGNPLCLGQVVTCCFLKQPDFNVLRHSGLFETLCRRLLSIIQAMKLRTSGVALG